MLEDGRAGFGREEGPCMATASTASITHSDPRAVPAALVKGCFVLFLVNAVFFPAAFFAHGWIYDDKGLGIPTDFVNVWAAGKLAQIGRAPCRERV